jgi:hypothetical protein
VKRVFTLHNSLFRLPSPDSGREPAPRIHQPS